MEIESTIGENSIRNCKFKIYEKNLPLKMILSLKFLARSIKEIHKLYANCLDENIEALKVYLFSGIQ
jgi:hypothetical protein